MKLEKDLLSNKSYKQFLNQEVTDISKNDSGVFIISTKSGIFNKFDKIVLANQPFQAIPLINNISPKILIDELRKWDKMRGRKSDN